jgi:hypothetical protein
VVADSDIPHHHSRAGQIHPFSQRRLFSEKLVELRIEIAHGRRMACFLGFVGQKALKTQKTRRSVSRADGLPNLSILSFSSSCAAKEKLPHVK